VIEESKEEVKRPQTGAPPVRQRGMKKFKKVVEEEPPIPEEEMSVNQKKKADAAKIKQ
jgi:hypothetical protein